MYYRFFFYQQKVSVYIYLYFIFQENICKYNPVAWLRHHFMLLLAQSTYSETRVYTPG